MHSHFLFPLFRMRSRSSVWLGHNAFFHRRRVAAWNFAGEGKSLKTWLERIYLHSVKYAAAVLFCFLLFFMNDVIRESLVHLVKTRTSTIQTCHLCRCSSVTHFLKQCVSVFPQACLRSSTSHVGALCSLPVRLLIQCRPSCARNSHSDTSLHLCPG